MGRGSPASGDGWWMSLLLGEQREGYIEAVPERLVESQIEKSGLHLTICQNGDLSQRRTTGSTGRHAL